VELAKEQWMQIKFIRVAETEINGVCMTLGVKWESKNTEDKQVGWS
jgi:hypothetical protein